MNELNIFFTDSETTTATSAPATETTAAEPTETKDTTPVENPVDAPVLTVGVTGQGDTVLTTEETTVTTETTAAAQANLGFEPMNFVDNLQYMGVGMLTIFMIIGAIILTTTLINWIFSRKKDKE